MLIEQSKGNIKIAHLLNKQDWEILESLIEPLKNFEYVSKKLQSDSESLSRIIPLLNILRTKL